MTRPLSFFAMRRCISSELPISPVGPRTFGQVRFAISAAQYSGLHREQHQHSVAEGMSSLGREDKQILDMVTR
jgi:hypothetical protein